MLRRHLVGHITAHTPVANELALCVVLGLAADAEVAHQTKAVAAPCQGAAEGQMRLQIGAVRRQLDLGHADAGHLPGCETQARFALNVRAAVGVVGGVDEAEVRVHFPEPIHTQTQQRAEAALALGHFVQRFASHANQHHANAPTRTHHQQQREHSVPRRLRGRRRRAVQVTRLFGPQQA